MYLKPIVPGPTDAGSFDRSGMWINAAPDGYAVTDVARGGPAAQAGIEVGDIITTLDGAAFRSEGLSDTRILLRSRPAGTKIPIELRRGADTKRVTLVLSDQIVAFQK
jgi:C-terminal processing protease CtpA/Prc